MKKLLLILLPLTLFIVSCGPDEEPVTKTGDLEITFAPTFMGQPFFVNQEYTFPDGMQVRFERFDFLVSDASSSGGSNAQVVDLAEVESINLTSNEASPLESTEFTWTSVNMVPQEYNGLQFSLGLNDELHLPYWPNWSAARHQFRWKLHD